MGDAVETMLKQVMTALMANNRALVAEVSQMDNTVDNLNEAIKLYLTKLTRGNLDESEAKRAMEIVSFAINLCRVRLHLALIANASHHAARRLYPGSADYSTRAARADRVILCGRRY